MKITRHRIIVFLIIILLLDCLICINVVRADDTSNQIFAAGDQFIVEGQQGDVNLVDDETVSIATFIGNFLSTIAIIVLIISTLIIGIKYMIATPEEAAKLKKKLIGLLISAIVIFMAYTMWSLAIKFMEQIDFSDDSDTDTTTTPIQDPNPAPTPNPNQDTVEIAAKIKNLSITSPASGTYKAGAKVVIRLECDKKIKGNAPDIEINFGGKKAKGKITKGKADGKSTYVEYNYTITAGDEGELTIPKYSGGTLVDSNNKSVELQKIGITGSKIIATIEGSRPAIGQPKPTYQDESIKITIESYQNCYIAKIWVSDPSKQIKKKDAGWKVGQKTVSSMLSPTEKAIIGCNGSGYYVGGYTPSSRSPVSKLSKSEWYNTTEGAYVKTNGVEHRYMQNEKCDSILGILPSGTLKYYNNVPTANARESVSTFKFGPILLLNGKKIKETNPRQSYSSTKRARTAIGQIDSNNYIIIVSQGDMAKGQTMDGLANIGLKYNCKLLYNLDGGGSAGLWYRKGTKAEAGDGTALRGRAVGDTLYFVTLK